MCLKYCKQTKNKVLAINLFKSECDCGSVHTDIHTAGKTAVAARTFIHRLQRFHTDENNVTHKLKRAVQFLNV